MPQLKKGVLVKKLDAVRAAASKGKDIEKLVTDSLVESGNDLSEEDRKALNGLRFELAKFWWENNRKTEALDTLLEFFDGYVEEDWTAQAADWIRNDQITDIKYRPILEKRLEIAPEDRRANLSLAKMVADLPSPTDEDIDIVVRAVKEHPLWKGGSSILSIRYLAEGRTDAEALDVYKNAYRHNKDNEELVRILTQSLIENQDKSEFALKFYRDQLDAGRDVPKALGLLCDAYLEKGEISPTTWPFIADALGRGMLSPEGVKHVSDFILTQEKSYFNRRDLAEQVYERGYRGQELLQYLADEYASELDISERTIPLFQDAFKQHALSKRSIRALTEHFLGRDDRGDFACRVYETYLSMVPELPQRKLYELLAQHYIQLGRADEQAKKIYEEALTTDPDNPEIIRMLAITYLAYHTDTQAAIDIYRRAFNIVTDDFTREKIALILAEHNVKIKRFDETTLEYLMTLKGAYPAHLEQQFSEALGYCFMNLDRHDEDAKRHYQRLYKSSTNPPARLIRVLAQIAVEEHQEGKPYSSEEIRLFEQVFELERFSCDPEVGFALLTHRLKENIEDPRLTQYAVRCFEADRARLVKLLGENGRPNLLVGIGDFYAEKFNYEQATVAYKDAAEQTNLDSAKYRFAKMLIIGGDAKGALSILSKLSIGGKKDEAQNLYWRGVCHLTLEDHRSAAECFNRIAEDAEMASHIPGYLIKLRRGQAQELNFEWQNARASYREVLDDPEARNFHRWAEIEISMLYLKEKRYEEALAQTEASYNKNRTGRAESRYYSTALFYCGATALKEGDIKKATSLLFQSVQVDMGDRLIRDVITDLLLIEGEKAFFARDFERARKLLETSLAILPRRIDTRSLLAFACHELRDYDQAILHYVNVPWDQVPEELEQSQAYAYFSSKRLEKAWRVFADLLRKGKFNKADLPLLFASYLSDPVWEGAKVFKDIEFDDDTIEFAQLYVHDGQYKRALELLSKLAKTDEYKNDLRIFWFQGLANAKLGNREMAVHFWREILKNADRPDVDKSKRMQEYLEIGLAFLESGYAKEAMQTWEALAGIDPHFEHLPKLYAETLSLNAYQLVRKADQVKTAISEWKKALQYDPKNMRLIQNLAIAYWQMDDFGNSTRFWNRMIDWWKKELERKPRQNAVYSVYIAEIQRVLTDLITTKGKAEHDLAKVRTEDVIDYYQKANKFYWLLNLDKRASIPQIERAYFRLVKIFNPERFADDFMLLEEAYANLTDSAKKEKIDLFAYNPLYLDELRTTVWGGKHVNVFGALKIKVNPPLPRYTYLKPSGLDWNEVMDKVTERLKLNLKLPDWNLV
ncbi:MAG: hypothetical protein HRF49_09765 [bacterium]|jgi:tetratricopeptide (TPR) repeat protein